MSDDNDTVDVQAVPHFDPNLKIQLTEKGYIVGLELVNADLRAENARLKAAISDAIRLDATSEQVGGEDLIRGMVYILRLAIEAGGE